MARPKAFVKARKFKDLTSPTMLCSHIDCSERSSSENRETSE
jgi:hypothetical protein